MASTALDHSDLHPAHAQKPFYAEKYPIHETPVAYGVEPEAARPYSPRGGSSLQPVYDSTHRKLKPRHIQLIGIGGYVVLYLPLRSEDPDDVGMLMAGEPCRTIGTALFVQIGESRGRVRSPFGDVNRRNRAWIDPSERPK